MLQNYEIIMIFDVQESDDTFKQTLDNINELITQTKGEVSKTTDLGNRQLAYPIKKRINGRYALINFSGDSKETIGKLNEKLKYMDIILRYMIVNNNS